MNAVMERITECLEQQGMKAPHMLEKIGITQSTYYSWRSRNISPDAESLSKIASFLGTTTDYLLTGNESSEDGYYVDPEVSELVNELKNNAGMRVLLDASRDLSKEDIFKLLETINKMKRGE